MNRAVLLLATFLLAMPAAAQTTGAIEGVVTDPSGAAVPNATVKLTHEATRVVTSTTTNSSGYFLVEGCWWASTIST